MFLVSCCAEAIDVRATLAAAASVVDGNGSHAQRMSTRCQCGDGDCVSAPPDGGTWHDSKSQTHERHGLHHHVGELHGSRHDSLPAFIHTQASALVLTLRLMINACHEVPLLPRSTRTSAVALLVRPVVALVSRLAVADCNVDACVEALVALKPIVEGVRGCSDARNAMVVCR